MEIGPSILTALIILSHFWATGQAFDRCESVKRLVTPAALVQLAARVRGLEAELEARAKADGCALNASFCRGATGTLQQMLSLRFGIETEAVINANLHTFLRLKRGAGRETVYIDPTIRQFIRPELQNRAPLVFVGNRSSLLALLKHCEVPPSTIRGYLKNLERDTVTPSFK